VNGHKTSGERKRGRLGLPLAGAGCVVHLGQLTRAHHQILGQKLRPPILFFVGNRGKIDEDSNTQITLSKKDSSLLFLLRISGFLSHLVF
jgi:hypothetical protein